MAVPDFQTIMLPLLQMIRDGREYSLTEMIRYLGHEFSLTAEELLERIPSGRQAKFYNRVAWATTHLKKAIVIENTKRGVFKITPRGTTILSNNPNRVDLSILATFPEWLAFKNKSRLAESSQPAFVCNLEAEAERTPDELLYESYRTIREALAAELLEKIMSCSPLFFERLVVELLVKMGYGGTLEDAGQVIGKSGDGGIDGIIKEDRLGLDKIYIQAKRWDGTVSRPDIQKFAGALLGNQARKGVFITTSTFSKEAREYVKTIASTIILIGGDELSDLMTDYGVGVSTVANYEIKRIDSDYFVEE